MSILFEELFSELNQDPEIRVAGDEYRLRRELAAILDKRRAEKGLTLRAMAERMDTSLSQVQRLFQEEHGGSLTLRTIVKAAMALDLKIGVGDSGDGQVKIVCNAPVAEPPGFGQSKILTPRRTATGRSSRRSANIA
ncbi:MAG TPA: helix-turn-helix transcriptional regulator [Myxococcota bacterium]|nr:helix-turn-helix transcriptional regulator [Myxococcota bacterium]